MTKLTRILRLFLVLMTVTGTNIFAFQAIAFAPETHVAINKHIAQGAYLDDYLKSHLGIADGKDAFFKNKKVFDLVANGGANEDSGIRSLNHFHNPLSNEGLSGQYSALTWAIGKEYRSSYSWYDVRDYYFQALTASDKANRDYWFVQTFQGVGQVMHLVQDMSIPAHVRRDTHLFGDGYEKWNRKYINDVSQVAGYGVYSYTPYNTSLFLIPQLFDTDQYNGSNPEITISSGGIGLAEYVNANYFSSDTINTSNFPYPRTDSNYKAIKLFNGPLGSYNREYFVKNCSGGYCEASASKSYQGYLLSAVDLNDYWRKKMTTSPYFLPVIPGLDENVHADYAQLLIPRAVGYSAEVLKYFFRGKLEVELGDGNIKIKNASTETINPDHGLNSHFYLYYDDAAGKRTLLTSALANVLAPGDSQTLTFSLPDGVIDCMLVYRGRLGDESDAVIGKVIHTVKPGNYYIFFLENNELIVANCKYVNNNFVIISQKAAAEVGMANFTDPVIFHLKRFTHNVSGTNRDLYFIATSLFLNSDAYDRETPMSWLSGSFNGSVYWYILDPVSSKLYVIPSVSGVPFKTIDGPSINFSADNNTIYVASGHIIKNYVFGDNGLNLISQKSYSENGFVGREGNMVVPGVNSIGQQWNSEEKDSVEIISGNGFYDYAFVWQNFKYSENHTIEYTQFSSAGSPIECIYSQHVFIAGSETPPSIIDYNLTLYLTLGATYDIGDGHLWSETAPGRTVWTMHRANQYFPVTISKTFGAPFYSSKDYLTYKYFYHTPSGENIDFSYESLSGGWYPINHFIPSFWSHIDTDTLLIQSFKMMRTINRGDNYGKIYKDGVSILSDVVTAVNTTEANLLGLVYLPAAGN